MNTVPYVHSNYERKENDDYQTIDPRCVDALVQSIPLCDYITDICASHGSGILARLKDHGFSGLRGMADAFGPYAGGNWIVTNPPYDRKIVDSFVLHALDLIKKKQAYGACFLMRANWDLASSRAWLFDNTLYYGQVRMRFRPWWSEERKAQPIHNYVWHIWNSSHKCEGGPRIVYWPKA